MKEPQDPHPCNTQTDAMNTQNQTPTQNLGHRMLVKLLTLFVLLLCLTVLMSLGSLIIEGCTGRDKPSIEEPPQPVAEPEVKEAVEEIPAETESESPTEPVPEEPAPKPGDPLVKDIAGIQYVFRWCPPGKFMMGAPNSEWVNRPAALPYDETPHEVELTKGFWLLETPVTQKMWQSVMGNNPSKFNGRGFWGLGAYDATNYPVERVSWDDCQEFCRRLGAKLGAEVKLPTEAQWEYACRAGNNDPYSGPLDSMAWYKDNSGSKPKPHRVGEKSPNAWGFRDMHGNVWEWCSDCYDKDYYKNSPAIDPENTTPSNIRVTRGGCYDNFYADAEECRSASRGHSPTVTKGPNIGFRVILIPEK